MSRKTPALLTAVVTALSAAGPVAQAQAAGGSPVQLSYATRTNGHLSIHSVATAPGEAGRRLRDIARMPAVVAADVTHTVRATALDPLLPQQTALRLLGAPAAWSYPDAHGAVVAVVDSGVDGNHPDLRGRVMQGAEFLDPRRETSSGNGWNGSFFHGTAVAGVIAAGVDDGIGMAGLARGVRILPVRVLDSTGQGSDVNVARGIIWAVDHGATVVNLSLGDSHPSSVEEQAVAYATARGVTVVASAGNDGAVGNPVMYPAAYPDVIAVGAYDDERVPAWFSEHGSFVDLGAPGDKVYVTMPGGGHATGSGTSFAAPFVSATAALVRGNLPRLSVSEVRAVLERTATDLGVAGRDEYFGAGSVNPAAVLAAVGLRATGTTTLSAPASVIAGSRISVRTTVIAPRASSASLQQMIAGRWRTVSQTRPNWLGQAVFTTAAPAVGRAVTYRVAATAVSTSRTVILRPVPPRTVTVRTAGRTGSGRVTATIRVAGGRTLSGVPVTLSARAPGSSAWGTLGNWRTGHDGSLVVAVDLNAGGTWRFRATAEGAVSAVCTAN